MDLLQSGDERERTWPGLRRLLEHRVAAWVVLLLAVAVAATTAGGVVAAGALRSEAAREAVRAGLDVLPDGGTSTTVAGVARGELRLLLVNRRDVPVQVESLAAEVEGLGLERVLPPAGELAPLEELPVRLVFVVPDCRRLVLPGSIVLVARVAGGEPVRLSVPVREPGGEEAGVPLGACPASSRTALPGTPTDVAARPAGGSAQREGAGARGVARLEVRNGGAALQLLGVTGEVPGVVFQAVRLSPGRSLETDGVVVVRLSFTIAECTRLQPAGRLVLRIVRGGAVQELGLRAVAEPEAGVGPQVRLPVVYGACG